MKKKELNIMGVGNSLPRYVSPTAIVMNVNVQGVLCDSGNESQAEYDFGDGGFTPQE